MKDNLREEFRDPASIWDEMGFLSIEDEIIAQAAPEVLEASTGYTCPVSQQGHCTSMGSHCVTMGGSCVTKQAHCTRII